MRILLVGFVLCCTVLAWVTVSELLSAPDLSAPERPASASSSPAATNPPLIRDQSEPMTTRPLLTTAPVDTATARQTPPELAHYASSASLPSVPPHAAKPRPIASRTPATAPETTTGQIHWAAPGSGAGSELGRALSDLAKYPHSRAALDEAIAASRRAGKPDTLLVVLQRGVERFPTDLDLRSAYATELMRQSLWTQAATQLDHILTSAPDDARAWFNLAICQQAAGRLDAARKAWDAFVARDPQQTDAYAYRGQVLLDLREWPAALADFERVLASQPNSPDAHLNAALAYVQLGRHDQALAHARQAVALAGTEPTVLNHAARIAMDACAADGPHSPGCRLAADYARRSLAIAPDQPAIRALLHAATDQP